MAAPRVLTRPPISEALVDIRAAVEQPREVLDALAQELTSEGFTKIEVKRAIRAELNVRDGKLLPPTETLTEFQGLRVTNSEGTLMVQFRPDGFTLNNLKSYIGGDRLIAESLRLWSMFVERTHPVLVNRVAFRYINRLELPLRTGDTFRRYLTSPPELPEGAPQSVSEFLSRVVGHDLPTESVAVVTQRLTFAKTGIPIVVIDVDVFRAGRFSVDPGELRPILDSLRVIRNRTFFSLLTEEAVSLFVWVQPHLRCRRSPHNSMTGPWVPRGRICAVGSTRRVIEIQSISGARKPIPG
jgi:uncharacterized protein (TIGR04255 family)